MLDLNEMKRRAEEVFRDAERGHEKLSVKLVMADLAVPLLQLIEAMEKKSGERWLLLDEVMARTGWSRKWFDKPQETYGGRSRLKVWEDEGLAEKAMNGFWLISPARVPDPKPGHTPPDDPPGAVEGAARNGNRPRPTPDVQGFADMFTEEE